MSNSFGTQTTLTVDGRDYEMFSLPTLADALPAVSSLPFSLRVLLENLLRLEDGVVVTADHIKTLAGWDPAGKPQDEIAFTPARVLLQDFTGVPVLVDLAAMRDAMRAMGGDPAKINPLQPVDLVIDHSVQVDSYRSSHALERNIELEYERNSERYAFLRWGQEAFKNFTAVPPGTGIVHQVNLEYLAHVAFVQKGTGAGGADRVYPDTLVGTDSHTTMINGLGVLGWGAGGIEAEAAMLGQPVSMLIPEVVGFELVGRLPEGATATDLVLTVTEMLRDHGVVGKFVEFYGSGLQALSLPDRATIGNMSPEFGSTCAIFPVDAETLRYLRMSGRSAEQVALVEAYYKSQGMFHTADSPTPRFSSTLTLDLASVAPSIAGPRRPQDRIPLSEAKGRVADAIRSIGASGGGGQGFSSFPLIESNSDAQAAAAVATQVAEATSSTTAVATAPHFDLSDGSVVIAAITSCTNTSNPSVMVAAGLVAKKAYELGLRSRPWVKTSLAPGSKVVTRYLGHSGLDHFLDEQGFNTVGYGCTTCIGNSGPLPEEVQQQVVERNLTVASVLSGNRNFEGRINNDVKMNFLASPPLVVAYALAGHMDWDPATEPLGVGSDGREVFLKDVWPSQEEVSETVASCVQGEMFRSTYEEVYLGDEHWRSMPVPTGDLFAWDENSTYIRRAPYFDGMPKVPAPVTDIVGARCLVKVGDSITTDHISPAGGFREETPAGKYLLDRGIAKPQFNSYGSRRGNHEIMIRGTFANVRLKNEIAPGTEGGFATFYGEGEMHGKQMSIFEASELYEQTSTPTIVLAGAEYGSGSSRDWAAKGPRLLGVRAAIAESYERIHRSNLVGMGILPLQFLSGDTRNSLGLTGAESFAITGVTDLFTPEARTSGLPGDRTVTVAATSPEGATTTFKALVRIDTPGEVQYYEHGGILQFVLRGLLES